MKAYLKQPFQVEQFDGSQSITDKYGIRLMPRATGVGRIDTLLATDVDGSHWLISDAIFKRMFEELPIIPEYTAEMIERCKAEHWALDSVFNAEVLTASEKNIVARAWLDGYTVEEEK